MKLIKDPWIPRRNHASLGEGVGRCSYVRLDHLQIADQVLSAEDDQKHIYDDVPAPSVAPHLGRRHAIAVDVAAGNQREGNLKEENRMPEDAS
jgi:hypothetical protein